MSQGAHKKGGFQRKEVKEFEEDVLEISRVTRVVKGGRKLRFRATVVIGNRKGKVGLGVGKSNEVTGAIQKAISKAKKNMITVTLDGTTIPHDTNVKYKASKLYLRPAAPGTGIIAGGTVRKVLGLVGVKDILSKALGTTNKICNARATIIALATMKNTPGMDHRAKVLAAKKAVPLSGTPKPVTPAKPVVKPATPAKPTVKPVAKPAAKHPETTQETSTKSA
jgi:small subunit ribosomal protein S5